MGNAVPTISFRAFIIKPCPLIQPVGQHPSSSHSITLFNETILLILVFKYHSVGCFISTYGGSDILYMHCPCSAPVITTWNFSHHQLMLYVSLLLDQTWGYSEAGVRHTSPGSNWARNMLRLVMNRHMSGFNTSSLPRPGSRRKVG